MARRGKQLVRYDAGVWQSMKARLLAGDDMHVRVGVLSGRGGNAVHSGGITMVELMAIHEFGSPAAGIPERAPIRTTYNESISEIRAMQIRLGKLLLTGKMNMPTALAMLGQWMASRIQRRVQQGPHLEPALADATVARKGSDRPLIDTGRLIQSITFQVEAGKP